MAAGPCTLRRERDRRADIARPLGILVVDHELALDDLRRLTAGKALILDLQLHRRSRWHPKDLMEPSAGQDSAWRQARRQGAQTYLAQAGSLVPTPLSLYLVQPRCWAPRSRVPAAREGLQNPGLIRLA